MNLEPLKTKNLPKPLKFRKLIGPSFILLGLGLGSGELILWPYLSSRYGLGIMWGALLGITFQFFINMEIERYTLITGESVFVGLARKLKIFSPIWFILSTFIPWMWPGIIASSAVLLASIFNIQYSSILPILLLLIIGMILTLGPIIYKTQETFQRLLIMIGVPFIFALTLYFAEPIDWLNLSLGIIGNGNDFWFLPIGISLATFLGAFAYSGAGGNLNLVQSYYIKDKGYGMGKFSGRITSILTGKKEKISLTGTTFKNNSKNLSRFKIWWKRINLEHFIVFWGTGVFTMLILSLLAYSTIFGSLKENIGINFIINEGAIINTAVPILGTIFLFIAAMMLFSTQFSILDATSRIMSENLIIFSPKKFKINKINSYYYSFLWVQIAMGIIIFLVGINQPLTLIIIGAVLNAFTMFVYSGLMLFLNKTSLRKELQPGLIRIAIVFLAFVFYGCFSILTILQYLKA